jgi:hypothetical protein
MTSFLRFTFAAVLLSFLSSGLRADGSSFALPAGDPLTVLALPEGLELRNVSLAVSKALVAEGWENLGWEGNVTTATAKVSRVNIKVYALASASDIKLYALYSSESNMTEEKCRQASVRELRTLEKTIAGKLELTFRKAKGDDVADHAEAG